MLINQSEHSTFNVDTKSLVLCIFRKTARLPQYHEKVQEKIKEIKELTTFTSKAHDPHSHRHKGNPINRFNEHTFKKNLPKKKGFMHMFACEELHVTNR